MRYRHLGKGVSGLLAGIVTICLLSLPASATTVTLAETAGTITFFNGDGDPVLVIPAAGDDCAAAAGTVVVSGGPSTGTVTGTRTKARKILIGTVHFRFTETWSYSGTWTTTTTGQTMAVTATVTMLSRRTTSNCTSIPDHSTCFISFGISISGVVTAANALPMWVVSDTVSLNGGPDGLTVLGNATACSVMVGAAGGTVSISGLNLHVNSSM